MAKKVEKKPPAKKGSMAELVKKYQKNADWKDKIYDPKAVREMKFIDTGSIVINKILGVPGIAKGRLIEIFGPEASGKSTLVQTIALNCLQEGGRVLYLDYEQCFDTGYAKRLGLNIDDPEYFVLATPDTLEEGWGICREFLDNVKDLDLIICDSTAAMTPKKILAQEVDKEGQIGLHSKLVGQFVTDLIKRIKKSETALVMVNQMRSRIKTNMFDVGPDTDTTGGRALKYYASVRLELRQRSIETIKAKSDVDGKVVDRPIGMIAQCINRKNKIADPFKKADFAIRFGEGIDNIRSVIDISENLRLITRAGGTYSFKDIVEPVNDSDFMTKEGGVVGKESLRDYLIKHQDVFKKLVNMISVDEEEEQEEVDEAEIDLGVVDELDVETEAAIKAEEVKAKRGRKKKSGEPEPEAEDVSDVSEETL